MSEEVADASAILAALRGEPGGDTVWRATSAVTISAVNYSEVATRLVDGGVPHEEVRTRLSGLGLEVVPFDGAQALEAAGLRPGTRHLGLGLGDRACLALARRLGVPAVTADRAWAQLDVGIPVRLIR